MKSKVRVKVLINWHGEVLAFYSHAKDDNQALSNTIRQLAKRLERTVKSVRDYVMDSGHLRWEIIERKVGYIPETILERSEYGKNVT